MNISLVIVILQIFRDALLASILGGLAAIVFNLFRRGAHPLNLYALIIPSAGLAFAFAVYDGYPRWAALAASVVSVFIAFGLHRFTTSISVTRRRPTRRK